MHDPPPSQRREKAGGRRGPPGRARGGAPRLQLPRDGHNGPLALVGHGQQHTFYTDKSTNTDNSINNSPFDGK